MMTRKSFLIGVALLALLVAGLPGAALAQSQLSQRANTLVSPAEVQTATASGRVTGVAGTDISIIGDSGRNWMVHTSASTNFTESGNAATLAAVTAGLLVSAQGTLNPDNSLMAQSVRITVPRATGRVGSVSGTDIALIGLSGGNWTIHTTATTSFTDSNRAAALADIRAGMVISAQGPAGADGSITARLVRIQLGSAWGRVTAVAGADISVLGNGGGNWTVRTSASTNITAGNSPATLADVKVGLFVSARGTSNPDGSLAASSVRISVPSASGRATGVTGGDIAIAENGGGTRTVHTNASTNITMGGNPATLADVVVGVLIGAHGPMAADGSITASTVRISVPRASGRVTGVAATDITIESRGDTTMIHTSVATRFTKSGQPAYLSDVVLGVLISAQGTLNADGSLTASSVSISIPSATGRVRSVSGTDISMVGDGGGVWTIHTNSSTVFTNEGRPATLADITAGKEITVHGTLNADGSMTARSINIIG